MIVLDASVLIALRTSRDAHSPAAVSIATHHSEYVVHPVTLAEALVVPARAGLATQAHAGLIDALDFRLWRPDDGEPQRVAILRATTSLKLPDCYVLSVAADLHAGLATFDEALARAGRTLGLTVVQQ